MTARSVPSLRAMLFATLCASLLAAAPAVARTTIADAAQPQLAAGADGKVWLVYGQAIDAAPPTAHGHGGHGAPARMGNVFVACSTDGGATFGPATLVAHLNKIALGMRRGPRIAVRGDHLTVTVMAEELVAFSSPDGGRTWNGPTTINDAPASAREGLHDLAAAPDGRLFATWLDLRNGKMELWGAESGDAGRTWTKNAQVYHSPDKAICECCHPSALFDAEGNLAVMWRNSIAGCRDLWMATRAKGAKEFAAAKKLGEGTWKLNACPMDGGKIVALGGGKFGAVWQRNGEVFLTPADGPRELLLGRGRQPFALRSGSDTIVFWQDGADLVSVRNPGQGEVRKFAADARFGVVIALPDNRGIVLAYEQGPAKERQPGFVVDRL